MLQSFIKIFTKHFISILSRLYKQKFASNSFQLSYTLLLNSIVFIFARNLSVRYALRFNNDASTTLTVRYCDVLCYSGDFGTRSIRTAEECIIKFCHSALVERENTAIKRFIFKTERYYFRNINFGESERTARGLSIQKKTRILSRSGNLGSPDISRFRRLLRRIYIYRSKRKKRRLCDFASRVRTEVKRGSTTRATPPSPLHTVERRASSVERLSFGKLSARPPKETLRWLRNYRPPSHPWPFRPSEGAHSSSTTLTETKSLLKVSVQPLPPHPPRVELCQTWPTPGLTPSGLCVPSLLRGLSYPTFIFLVGARDLSKCLQIAPA